MSGVAPPGRTGAVALLVGFACLAGVAAALAGRHLDVPGLYYDEVIQANPALQLLDPDGEPSRIPGARSARVLGRWVPVVIQPYMGALKSHALAPVFALFGATPAVLRLATLGFGLAGALLVMLWTRRVYGLPAALLTGAFLILDPSFLFVSRHDWGSVALGLLCRAGALLLLTGGFLGERSGPARARLFGGGLCLGLGLYNKIDFAVPVAAASAALLLSSPRTVFAALRTPSRTGFAALGAALGAAPLLAMLPDVLAATRFVTSGPGAGGVAERLATLRFALDGSYFHRLMLAGGSFEALGDVAGAAAGPFLWIFAGAALVLAARIALARGARAEAFALLAALLALAGIALTPRAGRIHHALNVWPFPQLVVALAVAAPWRPGAAGRAGGPGGSRAGAASAGSAFAVNAGRAMAALAAAAVVAGHLHVDLATLRTLRETGGKGRWSDALERFARELAAEPGAVAVSLDWGFDGPLRFTAPGLETSEPIWRLRRVRRAPRREPAVVLEGTPRDVYLVFDTPYAVFDFGPEFLERARTLPPERVTLRRHDDREGDAAFYSVRFADPHRLVYHGRGTWEIRPR